MRRNIISALAGISAFALATGASAAVIVNADGSVTTSGAGGGSWTVHFDGFGGDPTPVVIDGLTSSITFDFISAVAGVYTFNYSITNTSSAPITDSRVSLFGFNTDPNFTNASITGVFDTVGSGNVPNFGVVEFCGKDGGGTANCAGGGGGGVGFGATDGGTFTLTFAGDPTSITLGSFVVRYQSVDGSTILGPDGSAIGRPTDPIPEPGTWAMMLLGFAGAGYALRRSRRKSGELLQLA